MTRLPTWRRQVTAGVLLAASVAAPAAAEPPLIIDTSTGETFIVGLDDADRRFAEVADPAATSPGFESSLAPSGIRLPDISSYLDKDHGPGEVTYLTPRLNGLQFGLTHDQATSQEGGGLIGRDYRDGSGSKKPKSVSANYAENVGGLEFSFGGDYGRSPEPMRRGVQLVEDERLLRLGAHIGVWGFRLGGAFGSDIRPGDLGQTLSWNNFARYDRGRVSVGLVHSYTLQSADSEIQQAQSFGTLQGGFSFAVTPRLTTSLNAAYGSYLDEESSNDSSVAGVLGIHLRF